ncbi:transglutaminase [bacterium]|nr:transglutaminase [bacterium]
MKFLFVTLPLLIIKVCTVVLIVSIPVLGFWLASSVAAYYNGPTWLACVAGLLLFPILPLVWEAERAIKRRKRAETKPRFFGLLSRLTMKTLCISILFMGGFLVIRAETAFLALSTRGDWMLDHDLVQKRLHPDQRESVRQVLFSFSNQLEGLYNLFHQNPYRELVDRKPTEVAPGTLPEPAQADETPGPDSIETPGLWPWPGQELHQAVRSMPPSVETSIESVAEYLIAQESDPFLQIKALHDYVADRVAYDTEALRSGDFPAQDAETVFRTRRSVCAGYANLLAALGQASDLEILIITGDARGQGTDLSGIGHAWNAARIEDDWYLLDATWDSGFVNNYVYTKEYSMDYLFPPPQIMAITHFPDDPDWQLLSEPLTRGEFLRQPWLKPHFFAQGMTLLEPDRSQSDVEHHARILINNPDQIWLMARFKLKGSPSEQDCSLTRASHTQLDCPLPEKGMYEVSLYSSLEQYGSYDFVGKIEFNRKF